MPSSKKMGRPVKGPRPEPLNINLDPDLIKRVREYAERMQWTLRNAVESLLKIGLSNNEEK